jgi:hypothetical protein
MGAPRNKKKSMGKFLGAAFCLVIGAFLAVHGLTKVNLSSTDPSATYESVIGGRSTGIILSGEYVYTSGKALTALVSVPFLLFGAVLLVSALRRRPVPPKISGSILVGSFVSLPIYALVFSNMLGIQNSFCSAGLCIVCIGGVALALHRSTREERQEGLPL